MRSPLGGNLGQFCQLTLKILASINYSAMMNYIGYQHKIYFSVSIDGEKSIHFPYSYKSRIYTIYHDGLKKKPTVCDDSALFQLNLHFCIDTILICHLISNVGET